MSSISPTLTISVPKVWRSELPYLLVYLTDLVITAVASAHLPHLVIRGELFRIAGYRVMLDLPLLWLGTVFIFGVCIQRIYNVRYLVTEDGIESTEGILSFRQIVTQIRFEDIRSIESDQSLWGRMVNVGNVEVGTAAVGIQEIILHGVDSPKQIQRLIQERRDRILKLAQKSTHLEESSTTQVETLEDRTGT